MPTLFEQSMENKFIIFHGMGAGGGVEYENNIFCLTIPYPQKRFSILLKKALFYL